VNTKLSTIEDLPYVSFFCVGPGGAFNASGDAYAFITRKLPKKNKQLTIANHERVVLIIGWAPLIGKRDMIEAFSQIDFSQYPNIDKVYFTFPNQAQVDLIYDRQVYQSFQPNGAPPAQINSLFVSWLGNYLARKSPQAFSLVRQIGDQKNSLEWLPGLSREQLVDIGEEFVDQGKSEELHWIVDRLRCDPDPILENAPDGNTTDHERVKRGEEIRFIRSVRGRLCWLLMKMVVKPRTEDYGKVFEIVEQLATNDNLYVRQQATIPLHELARRRYAKTSSGDNFMSSDLASAIKNLAQRMIEENKQYPAVLEYVARVVDAVRDVDQDTAFSVLTKLFSIDNSEAADTISCLAIHFAFFRVNLFKELGLFDPGTIRALLLDRLKNGAERFRAFSAQHFKEILERDQLPFDVVFPYLQALVKGSPSRPINHHLYTMAAKQAQAHPNEIGSLIEVSVAAEMEMIAKTGREVWYSSQFKRALSAREEILQTVISLILFAVFDSPCEEIFSSRVNRDDTAQLDWPETPLPSARSDAKSLLNIGNAAT
jgi:hypothetical protein